MGLSKKTFLYSLLISIVLVGFLVIYFVWMLPSLYVDHEKEKNLDSILKMQEEYMKSRNLDKVSLRNPTSSLIMEIPKTGNKIYLVGKFFKVSAEIEDYELQRMLEKLRYYMEDYERMEEFDKADFDFSSLKEKLFSQGDHQWEKLVKIEGEVFENAVNYKDESIQYYYISKRIMIIEASVSDERNEYTNYVGMGKTDDGVVISFLSVMTPQMGEIKPIILSSLPMISTVAFLLVLICSQFYSKKIINPIIRLANYAEYARNSSNMDITPLEIREQDEIGELGRALNELYEALKGNYMELEKKNKELARENERQEVFLRASSHQLKTPITAALLLVDGMMNEIGKYKDTKAYLPKVKEQLQSMRKIVEDILYLNRKMMEGDPEEVNVRGVVEEVMRSYQIQMTDKGICFGLEGEMNKIYVNLEILKKVIDNLVSNAVAYTSREGRIRILLENSRIIIENDPAKIPDELLPHIYEPFVSSNTENKGHGLGLYVVHYCTKILGCSLEVKNTESGVQSILELSSNMHDNFI